MTPTVPLPAGDSSYLIAGQRPLPLVATTVCPDPGPVFDRLYAQHGPVAPIELEPGVPAWLVLGYTELLALTREEHLFSRDARNWRAFQDGTVPADSPLGPMMFFRDNVIGYDGLEHRRLRRPLHDAVASIDHRRLRRRVETLCGELIGGFARHGDADLLADYAALIPMLAIGDLFSLNPAQGRDMLAALQALFGSGADAQAGNARFEAIITGVMRWRNDEPAGDLTTLLLRHPDLRSEDEVRQSIVVMVSAGNHTTTSWIAQTLRLMLTDPRFAGRLRGGRLGVDDALDEVLFAEPPMINMPARYALRDTELGGRLIRRGDALILGLAAAGRDPRAHPATHHHGNRAHLAWSAGPHACPARDPARTITRTAVETALHLLPDIRLAVPAENLTTQPSPWTRCPAALPVHFTAHSKAHRQPFAATAGGQR